MNGPRDVHASASVTKIVILTGASLSWNPRALKEAMTLAYAGFNIVVYGANSNLARFHADQALAHRHGFRFESAIPISRLALANRLRSTWSRLRGRLGREFFRISRIENRWQLGPLVSALLYQAVAESADYYIVHLEQAAWVGRRLLEMGKRVGVDIEDWYSEDLLPDARGQRPLGLLRALEADLLRRGGHATCPSWAMSDALAKSYGCLSPVVIYNAFRWADRKSLDGEFKDRRELRIPSIHWFSQTIGPNRGLEDLFASLPFMVHEVQIHLRGNPVPELDSWLSKHIPVGWHDRVFVHSLVPHEELLSRISEHDIGFAGEMKYCKNKDLTISNKILHYLLAGLAVVASDTTGQREVAAKTQDAVFLYPCGDFLALSQRLNGLIESPERMARAKFAALRSAEQTFCWERQEDALLGSIRCALDSAGSMP